MPYLMIHDIRSDYFDLDLEPFQLTFDDGLFSQYYYFPLLKDHPRKLTYFITTSFIRPGKARDMYAGEPIAYLKSKKYMRRTFSDGRFDHFMRLEEVQALSTQPNVQLGVHSHFHDVIMTHTPSSNRKPLSQWKLERFKNHPGISAMNMSIRSKLAFQGYALKNGRLTKRTQAQWEDYIKYDTQLCLEWMTKHLGFSPELYCFPFNEYNERLISILKTFGFKRFFAARAKHCEDVLARTDIDSLAAPLESGNG